MIGDILFNLSALIFVIASMLSMGFSLTGSMILEPLKNWKLVVGALLVNFAIVPLVGYLLLLVIPLGQGLMIGVALLATAAGAPFIPKLAQAAKGDIAFSVGLMTLLMAVTVIFVPVVLPYMVPGASINPLSIASSLIILMIIPLCIGLFTRARYKNIADQLKPYMNQASTIGLLAVIILGIIVNWEYLVSAIGSYAILFALIFYPVCFVCGWFFAGKNKDKRSVMGLGTAQRNVSAALVVAAQNFAGTPEVIVMVIVGALIGLFILFPIAGELGRRASKASPNSKEPKNS